MELDLVNKLKFIKALDDIRWGEDNKEKYNFETSFYAYSTKFPEDMDEEKKKQLAEKILLTHWLIYICDRQMDYRHIFKAGGYVISKMVDDFYNQIYGNQKNLNEFFKDYIAIKIEKNDKNEYKPKFKLMVPKPDGNKKYKKVDKYFSNLPLNIHDNKYLFASRFITADLYCIYKTLKKLSETHFLSNLDKVSDINELAEYLYELTYQATCTLNKAIKTDIKEEKFLYKNDTRYDEIVEELFTYFQTSKKDLHTKKTKKICSKYTFKNNKHTSKRLWCVIRDFLYHPIFKNCFETIAGATKFSNFKQQAEIIELPGDVWNNNLTFANCFWGKKNVLKNKINSSKFLREQYDRNKDLFEKAKCLPIHFDITFNYVPRMCSSDNCTICPINPNKKSQNNVSGEIYFDIICHEIKDKVCPFVLYATDLTYICNGKEKCEILKSFSETQTNEKKINNSQK